MKSFHHLLMKSHTLLNKKIMTAAQSYNLTVGQPKILEYLLEVKCADQKSIAKYCEIEPATVGSILNRMEEAELIERKRENGNRRSLFVSLTEKGYQKALTTQQLFEKAEKIALDSIPEELQQKVCEVLEKVYDNLQKAENIK